MPPKRDPETGRFVFTTGKCIDSKGYVRITHGPHRGRREHRVKAEHKLGRKLSKKEDVHHDNGVKTDNADHNLVPMSHSDHTHLEWTIRQDRFLREQWEAHFGESFDGETGGGQC
jgi:hypothetical protein